MYKLFNYFRRQVKMIQSYASSTDIVNALLNQKEKRKLWNCFCGLSSVACRVMGFIMDPSLICALNTYLREWTLNLENKIIYLGETISAHIGLHQMEDCV